MSETGCVGTSPVYCSGADLRSACAGKHGKTFCMKGVQGFWTFLYEVPGDSHSAVFRDNAGVTQMREYSQIAPLVSSVK